MGLFLKIKSGPESVTLTHKKTNCPYIHLISSYHRKLSAYVIAGMFGSCLGVFKVVLQLFLLLNEWSLTERGDN